MRGRANRDGKRTKIARVGYGKPFEHIRVLKMCEGEPTGTGKRTKIARARYGKPFEHIYVLKMCEGERTGSMLVFLC